MMTNNLLVTPLLDYFDATYVNVTALHIQRPRTEASICHEHWGGGPNSLPCPSHSFHFPSLSPPLAFPSPFTPLRKILGGGARPPWAPQDWRLWPRTSSGAAQHYCLSGCNAYQQRLEAKKCNLYEATLTNNDCMSWNNNLLSQDRCAVCRRGHADGCSHSTDAAWPGQLPAKSMRGTSWPRVGIGHPCTPMSVPTHWVWETVIKFCMMIKLY